MAGLDLDRGCLTGEAGTPRFDLDADQVELIKSALPEVDNAIFNDAQMIDKTLVAFNCLACHEREGLGGVVHNHLISRNW